MGDPLETMSWELLRDEARSLIEAADRAGLVLRLVGSAGIRLHGGEEEALLSKLRQTPKDIDFVCRKRDRNRLREFFESRGYEVDRNMLVAMEGQRYLYRHGETGLKIDLFVDRLDFCHRIDLRHRLDRHPLSIPLDDLLLHKLQIVELTAGDLIDVGVLLFLHDVDDGFDAGYIGGLLGSDWGFWRTATGNLEVIREHAERGGYADLGGNAGSIVAERCRALTCVIEAAPKSVRWKMRAKMGARAQWWNDVDDREGTY